MRGDIIKYDVTGEQEHGPIGIAWQYIEVDREDIEKCLANPDSEVAYLFVCEEHGHPWTIHPTFEHGFRTMEQVDRQAAAMEVRGYTWHLVEFRTLLTYHEKMDLPRLDGRIWERQNPAERYPCRLINPGEEGKSWR